MVSWSEVLIVSPNLFLDTLFRKQVLGSGQKSSAEEVMSIVKEAMDAKAISNEKIADDHNQRIVINIHSSTVPTTAVSPSVSRGELEVKAKLFLKDMCPTSASRAITTLLNIMESPYVDSLQLAVPEKGVECLGIASEPKPKCEKYASRLNQFLELYSSMEENLEDGSVKAMGVCDIEGHTLKELFKRAKHKPNSITINLHACCSIPSDLSDFARRNNVELKTHSDPDVMLEEKRMGDLGLTMDWIIRYQVMDRLRGVIRDKRYLVALKNTDDPHIHSYDGF